MERPPAAHLTLLLLLLEPLLEDRLSQSARRAARAGRRLVRGQGPDDVERGRGGGGGGARRPAPEPQEAAARSHTHGEHGGGRHVGLKLELPASGWEKDKRARLAGAGLSGRQDAHSEQRQATWSRGRAGARASGPIRSKSESDLRLPHTTAMTVNGKMPKVWSVISAVHHKYCQNKTFPNVTTLNINKGNKSELCVRIK